jgi:hypothetical protein
MKIFQQNKKMQKAGVLTYNFSLPAISTCPGAGKCADKGKGYCFAYLEQLRYPSAREYRERSLTIAKSGQMISILSDAIDYLQQKAGEGVKLAIRIHASGDFYSAGYLLQWATIAQLHPDITFYAYTKSVAIVKQLQKQGWSSPANLILIYSLGGKHDRLVDVETDRHSRIFADADTALAAGYTLASEDDSQAWSSSSNKIGLVMFGARKNKGNQVLGNAA